MRTNAREEFEQHTKGKKISCAIITFGDEYDDLEDVKTYKLPAGYNDSQMMEFLVDIGRHNYDSGYGGQELFGTIWYDDRSWSERGEYDGSEWWVHRVEPPVPEDMKQIIKIYHH